MMRYQVKVHSPPDIWVEADGFEVSPGGALVFWRLVPSAGREPFERCSCLAFGGGTWLMISEVPNPDFGAVAR